MITRNIKIGGVGRACMSTRAAGRRLDRRLSFEKTPQFMESLTKVAVVIIGVGGSLAIIDRTFKGIDHVVQNAIMSSKPGSAEEASALKKVENASQAAASGAAKGTLEVTGTPRDWWRYLFWKNSNGAESPKKP
jgi:hypothetical protein